MHDGHSMARVLHGAGAMCRSSSALFFGSLVVLGACGGNIEHVTGDGADPGASSSSGSSSSSASSGSSSGGAAGGGRQCTLAPSCDDGDRAFARASDACIEVAGVSCYERSACGATIWCQHTDTSCKALPTCPADYAKVPSCIPDADCTTVTACGTTIICQRDLPPCPGPKPICDDGDTEVPSASQCLQDDARCYSRSNGCGYTIWCTGPAK